MIIGRFSKVVVMLGTCSGVGCRGWRDVPEPRKLGVVRGSQAHPGPRMVDGGCSLEVRGTGEHGGTGRIRRLNLKDRIGRTRTGGPPRFVRPLTSVAVCWVSGCRVLGW